MRMGKLSRGVSPNDREYKRCDASAGTAEVREEGGRRRRNDVGGGCGVVRSTIDRRGGLGRENPSPPKKLPYTRLKLSPDEIAKVQRFDAFLFLVSFTIEWLTNIEP